MIRAAKEKIRKAKKICLGMVFQLHYAAKYATMPHQHRNVRLIAIATGRPKNVLVELPEGKKVVVPFGNLFEPKFDRNQLAKSISYESPIEMTVDDFLNPKENTEIPANLQFVDMGINEHFNTHLDETQQGRIFREWCIQANGANYALYEKRAVDLAPPQHHRPEWIAEKLSIPIDLAFQLVEIFKDFSLDRKSCLGLIYNAEKANRLDEMAKGFCHYPRQQFKINELVNNLRNIKSELDTAAAAQIESGNAPKHINEFYTENMVYFIEDSLPEQADIDPDTGEAYATDNLDNGDFNPIGAFRLSDGNDALTQEKRNQIMTADRKLINDLIARFYDTYKFYFTPQMSAHFWALIKARKNQLKDSPEVKLIREEIKKNGATPAVIEYIKAFADGRPVILYGETFHEFTRKADKSELKKLWTAYKKSKARQIAAAA